MRFLARSVRDEEATGSNPATPTRFFQVTALVTFHDAPTGLRRVRFLGADWEQIMVVVFPFA